jgi:hypothetical protein
MAHSVCMGRLVASRSLIMAVGHDTILRLPEGSCQSPAGLVLLAQLFRSRPFGRVTPMVDKAAGIESRDNRRYRPIAEQHQSNPDHENRRRR